MRRRSGSSPRPLLVALCLALASGAGPATAVLAADDEALAKKLAASGRSDQDKARDAGRKPAQVLTFLGVEPGMTAVDVIAASGWYTEVLSVAVGPDGKVYAQNPEAVLKFRDGANDKALTARLADGRLPNVERVDVTLAESSIPDGSVDVAITALNFHDVYDRAEDGPAAGKAFLEAIHEKLKPGGALVLIDHVGVAGQDNPELHRIEKQKVLDVIAETDFVLDAESKILANESDDHTQNVFAPELRGHTDRFVLRLKKAEG